jgi:hypothetical protein
VLRHRTQRCNPGLAHPSLAHVGLESYSNCFSRLHGGARGGGPGVVVESSRRWEGCERKSQPTSKVFGRALMGVMNEGAVGQTATGGCMVTPLLHDSSRTALFLRCMTVQLEKVTLGCAFRMCEARRRIGGAGCPQRVGWAHAPCPSSQTS